MHAGARVRRAVRHVRRFRDRVRRRGRLPTAQVPGAAGDAEDHGRAGAPAAQRAAATAPPRTGRRHRHRHRRRVHPQLAGRHHGAQQAARLQVGRDPGQAEQLIGRDRSSTVAPFPNTVHCSRVT